MGGKEVPVGLRNHENVNSESNQTTANETRIWSIGELGGGTKYFGRNNLLGIYRMFKDRISNGTEPDVIIFHGEVLPEVPKFISKQAKQRSLIITDHVENVDESVVMMKPHLSRITDLIKEKKAKTEILYVMGHSDLMNVDREYEIINSSYNYDPEHLFIMRQRYKQVLLELEKKLESLQLQIKQKEEALSKFKNPKGKPQALKKLESDISKLKEKESQKSSERNDTGEIQNLYSELVKMWIIEGRKDMKYLIEKLGGYLDDDLFKIIAKYRREDALSLAKEYESELDSIIEKIESGKGKSRKSRLRLEKKSKEIGNLLTKLSNEIITKEKAGEEIKQDMRLEQGYRFTNNIPGTPTRSKLTQELSLKIVRSRISDVFGRRININIVSDRSTLIEKNGLKVFVSNKPSNTSHQFMKDPKKGSGSFEWALRTVGRDADLMITSGSYMGVSTYVPKHDKSPEFCYQLSSPPCVDSNRIIEAWNARLKTWFTEILSKGKGTLGSGFDELEIVDNKVKHTFFSEEILKRMADNEKKYQSTVLAKIVERAGTYEQTSVPLDKKDKIQLENKLPSEITNKRRVRSLLEGLGITNSDLRRKLGAKIRAGEYSSEETRLQAALGFFSEQLSQSGSRREVAKRDFVVITDVHVGSPGIGYPNELLLDASVSYIKDKLRDGFVLCLMGDNIEGNLRDHKNEMLIDNDPANIQRFKSFISQKGMVQGSKEYKEALQKYTTWLYYKTPKQNTNAQADAFVSLVKPLLSDAAAVVVTDGNHPNKSYIRKDITESGMLFGNIEQAVPETKRSYVKRVYGGDYGHGNVNVGDLPVLFSHRVMPESVVGGLGMEGCLAVGGDRHVHEASIVGGKLVFTGAQMQGDSGFAQTIGIPVSESLRGFSMFSVIYDPEDPKKVLASTDTFIHMAHLKKVGYVSDDPLIKEFESSLRKIKVESELLKIRS